MILILKLTFRSLFFVKIQYITIIQLHAPLRIGSRLIK